MWEYLKSFAIYLVATGPVSLLLASAYDFTQWQWWASIVAIGWAAGFIAAVRSAGN